MLWQRKFLTSNTNVITSNLIICHFRWIFFYYWQLYWMALVFLLCNKTVKSSLKSKMWGVPFLLILFKSCCRQPDCFRFSISGHIRPWYLLTQNRYAKQMHFHVWEYDWYSDCKLVQNKQADQFPLAMFGLSRRDSLKLGCDKKLQEFACRKKGNNPYYVYTVCQTASYLASVAVKDLD